MFGFGNRSENKTMDPQEVRQQLAAGAIRLVDVREDSEWAQARIPGAIHVPLSRLRDLAASIPIDKPVVFQCLSGARSAQAVAVCRALGLPHDTHMPGGISIWQAHGFSIAR